MQTGLTTHASENTMRSWLTDLHMYMLTLNMRQAEEVSPIDKFLYFSSVFGDDGYDYTTLSKGGRHWYGNYNFFSFFLTLPQLRFSYLI